MLLLWVATTILLYCAFLALTRWLERCFVGGCPRRVKPDRLWCEMHERLILEESRRVGQTAGSSSAPVEGDVPKTHDAVPRTSGSTFAYSSSAGLRLTPQVRPPTPPRPRLHIVRPYDQEENP